MESDEKKNEAADEIASVLGGIDVDVVYRDGKTETVKVRELGCDEVSLYWKVIDFEGAAVELFCGRPKGWADRLARESFKKLIDTGQGLNLPFLSDWLARSVARMKALNPGMGKIVKEMTQKAIDSLSPGSSSQSQSKTGSP